MLPYQHYHIDMLIVLYQVIDEWIHMTMSNYTIAYLITPMADASHQAQHMVTRTIDICTHANEWVRVANT